MGMGIGDWRLGIKNKKIKPITKKKKQKNYINLKENKDKKKINKLDKNKDRVIICRFFEKK